MKRAKLVRQLEGRGLEVRASRRQHLLVYGGGRLVATMSSTPSDHRSDRNAMAAIKRAGF